MRWIEPIPFRAIWKQAALASVVVALLGLSFAAPKIGVGDPFRHLSYDLFFKIRGSIPVPTNEQVVIVYMDHESAKTLNPVGYIAGAPWDPRVHARLTLDPKIRKAKALVFDILFTETNSANISAYEELAQAIKTHGRVVVGAHLQAPTVEETVRSINEPEFAYPSIRAVSRWGIVEFEKSSDSAVREQRPIAGWTNMAWATADLIGRTNSNFKATRGINFYSPPPSITSVNYSRIFANDLPENFFANKIVFVGKKSIITGEGATRDDFPIPFTFWPFPSGGFMNGVEIQATAFLNLVHNDWLSELLPEIQFAIFVLAAPLFAFGLIFFRPWIATAISLGLFCGIATIALYCTWRFRVWFPWMAIGAVQIPVALSWAVLLNMRKVYHDKEVLELTVATARSAAGAAAPGSATGSGPLAALQAIHAAADRTSSDLPTLVSQDSGVSPGPQVIGDHELIRSIGKGAYGEVWLGKSLVGILRAVKVVYRRSFQHAAPFEREFRGLKKFAPISLSYTGFVQILHVGKNDTEGYFYYVMELGDDETTGQNISSETYSAKNLGKELKKRGSLPLRECLSIGVELAAALHHLHEQELIHRDIKPSNIIFVKGTPKLADIGLVTAIEAAGGDATYVGTPGYIAPEGPGSRAADIFSLGKVLYECSMGLDCHQYPELPASLLERPEKDDLLALNNIISKACDPDPTCRFATAAELRNDLLKLQSTLTGKARVAT